jgi:hypothetical protein
MTDWTANASSDASATRAHSVHVAMVALHSLCCGVPVLIASLGAAAGALAWGGMFLTLHDVVHHYEYLILAASALLVATGAYFEWRARRRGAKGFPFLFALSAACFLVNVAIVVSHRAPVETWVQPSAAIASAPVSHVGHDHAHDHDHAH